MRTYVFDDSQELRECCSCLISADGVLSESVDKNLTANELTGRAEKTRGVIKVISAANNEPTNDILEIGLRGSMTHVQSTSNIPSKGPFDLIPAFRTKVSMISSKERGRVHVEE